MHDLDREEYDLRRRWTTPLVWEDRKPERKDFKAPAQKDTRREVNKKKRK